MLRIAFLDSGSENGFPGHWDPQQLPWTRVPWPPAGPQLQLLLLYLLWLFFWLAAAEVTGKAEQISTEITSPCHSGR